MLTELLLTPRACACVCSSTSAEGGRSDEGPGASAAPVLATLPGRSAPVAITRLPWRGIELQEVIGEGSCGLVARGTVGGVAAAIKVFCGRRAAAKAHREAAAYTVRCVARSCPSTQCAPRACHALHATLVPTTALLST